MEQRVQRTGKELQSQLAVAEQQWPRTCAGYALLVQRHEVEQRAQRTGKELQSQLAVAEQTVAAQVRRICIISTATRSGATCPENW